MFEYYSHCFCSESIFLSLLYPAHLEPGTLAMRAKEEGLSSNAHHILFYEEGEDRFIPIRSLEGPKPIVRVDKYLRTLTETVPSSQGEGIQENVWRNVSIIFAYTDRSLHPGGEHNLDPYLEQAREEGLSLLFLLDGQLLFSWPRGT